MVSMHSLVEGIVPRTLCMHRHHELQAANEGRVSELQARLQVAQFERERVAMAAEEATKQLSTVQLEKEKLQKKVCVCVRVCVCL